MLTSTKLFDTMFNVNKSLIGSSSRRRNDITPNDRRLVLLVNTNVSPENLLC